MDTPETNIKKLDELLAVVQTEAVDDDFIYGVTLRSSRTFTKKLNDFLIDHSRVPLKEKAYFFELLATMLHAGIPLIKALQILKAKTENLRLKRVIATIAYEIDHGRALSDSLDRFSDIFNESERGIIRSAEAVGSLDAVLFKVAGTLDRQARLNSKLAGALVYPATVTVALIASVIVILIFVVPRMQELFTGGNINMPLTTRVLFGLSFWMASNWWILLLALLFGGIGLHIYTSSDEGKFSWDFQILRIPLVGKLLRKILVLRFVDTLGLLLESGLTINKALEYVANSMGNEVYRMKTYEALGSVQSGQPLSASLKKAPFLFPETVVNMLAVGEQSASLGDMAVKVGKHYQREINHTLKQVTTLLGPMLILVIGGAVSFFAIAILSPIFSLTQAVQ